MQDVSADKDRLGVRVQSRQNSLLTQTVLHVGSSLVANGLCCTNRMRDSSYESSVVAEMHEQLDPDDLQDQELVRLQPSPEAARFSFNLV